MTAKCLLERSPRPTREQVREELSGNLCRRTGYQSLVEGVLAAAEIAAGGGDE
ncbi:2Fe-2S iron-sulfur cluster-binding protein [Pseudonocardia sp. NPDC049154]|uniref:2Fe-2S iron-sulfur cluster-binding protein n=1 Tax=Pseudonocardia sp. NPDC049154 TaxID=3155501 RepID=UPI0033F18884